ncbi:MAG: acyl carrier protein [Gemmatimonadaceae bacterium]
MTRTEFLSEFEIVALQAPGSIKGQEALDSLDGWDSLAVVEFMSMADEKLGVQLDPRKVATCSNVDDLASLCGIAA